MQCMTNKFELHRLFDRAMESKRGQSGRLSTCKSSHMISKSNSPAQRISPVIRVVHICPPIFVNTDAANFRTIVQELTGNHSVCTTQKKLNPNFSEKIVRDERDKEESWLSFGEEQSNSHLPDVKLENDQTSSSDRFCGFEEMDIFTALLDSIAMLPEFPTITPAIDHTDCLTPISISMYS